MESKLIIKDLKVYDTYNDFSSKDELSILKITPTYIYLDSKESISSKFNFQSLSSYKYEKETIRIKKEELFSLLRYTEPNSKNSFCSIYQIYIKHEDGSLEGNVNELTLLKSLNTVITAKAIQFVTAMKNIEESIKDEEMYQNKINRKY